MNVLKPFTAVLLIILLMMQFRLWAGSSSFTEQAELTEQVKAQSIENQRNQARNTIIFAEITDLRTGSEAIEERARHELGMIRPGEVFYRVVKN